MVGGEWCNVGFYLKPARGSTGGGGDNHAASEQPDPAGELPEADGAAERPDWDREPYGSRPGKCADTERSVGGAGWQDNAYRLCDFRISSERAVCTSSPRRACSRECSSWLVQHNYCFKWPSIWVFVLILNFDCLFSSQTCSSTQAKVSQQQISSKCTDSCHCMAWSWVSKLEFFTLSFRPRWACAGDSLVLTVGASFVPHDETQQSSSVQTACWAGGRGSPNVACFCFTPGCSS